jgi:hypothetical protein
MKQREWAASLETNEMKSKVGTLPTTSYKNLPVAYHTLPAAVQGVMVLCKRMRMTADIDSSIGEAIG